MAENNPPTQMYGCRLRIIRSHIDLEAEIDRLRQACQAAHGEIVRLQEELDDENGVDSSVNVVALRLEEVLDRG